MNTASQKDGLVRKIVLTQLSQYLHDPKCRRVWILAAQDGIIATAGVLLGFVGAGAADSTLLIAATASTVVGMLSTGGAEWAEAAAEREAQMRALGHSKVQLKQGEGLRPSALVAYFERKGISRDLATKVADEMMARSPLKAALEAEHGLLQLMPKAEVIWTGIGASLAYSAGAGIPFAITFFLPVEIEGHMIIGSALVSLLLISVAGARVANLDLKKNIKRTLAVGLVTISASYLVGDVFFER